MIKKVFRFFGKVTPYNVFEKIVAGELPSKTFYEDEKIKIFESTDKKAPIHLLVIPKVKGNLDRLSNVREEDDALLGYMLRKSG